MSLLKLRAKVLLTSEDQMESEEKYDLGNIAKSKEWVWRNLAVPVDEVYKIIEYDATKSIVQLRDEEKILVKEPFDELFGRWETLKVIEMQGEEGENENDLDLSGEYKEDEDDEGDVPK